MSWNKHVNGYIGHYPLDHREKYLGERVYKKISDVSLGSSDEDFFDLKVFKIQDTDGMIRFYAHRYAEDLDCDSDDSIQIVQVDDPTYFSWKIFLDDYGNNPEPEVIDISEYCK